MTLKFTEKMEIARFLEKVTFDNDGYRSYQPNWTDMRVAEELEITRYIVGAIRKEIYPNFGRRTDPESKGPSRASLMSLEAKIAELEQRIIILEQQQETQPQVDMTKKRTLKPISRWDQ